MENEINKYLISASSALDRSFSDIEKRNLSLVDDFSIEPVNGHWKIVYGFSGCGANDGDVFLVDRLNGKIKQSSDVLRALKTRQVDDSKKSVLLSIFIRTYEDAFSAYRHLEGYRICVSLKGSHVYVDYFLIDPRARGGGPHYIVDSRSYNILERRYEQ